MSSRNSLQKSFLSKLLISKFKPRLVSFMALNEKRTKFMAYKIIDFSYSKYLIKIKTHFSLFRIYFCDVTRKRNISRLVRLNPFKPSEARLDSKYRS